MKTLLRGSCSLAALAVLGSPASAQDSVSNLPGTPDAFVTYDNLAVVRYVVDLVGLTSSWGNEFLIGPVLKANADFDPLFTTQLLGASAVSPDQVENVSFASTPYMHWTVAQQGANEFLNDAPGSLNVTGFDRQFGIAFSDFASIDTNVVGALVGQDDTFTRLYVTRVLAAAGRYDETQPLTASLSLGAVDGRGNLYLRADDFNCSGSKIVGDNIVRINLPARNTGINTLRNTGGGNTSDQPAATTYVLNNSTTTTNTPAVLPATGATSPLAVILDFANTYRANGAAGVSTHLGAGIGSHRGNPYFSSVITAFGGVGSAVSAARPTGATPKVQSLNLFGLSSAGAVQTTRGATMPSPITDGAGFSANAAGDAEFLQYLSQTSFRGASGQAAVGHDPLTGSTLAAATATDPTQGDFIAVAKINGGTTNWTVAAHVGKAVLDGPAGGTVGTIALAVPLSISAPAIDTQGNIYFVAAYQPTAGMLTQALIKAVNTASGYRLEKLLHAGQMFTGANSTRQFTVSRLTLGDSDSIASGSFFSGNLLQPTFPGRSVEGPDDPFAFGGAIVNAKLVYDNEGTPEEYQAVLFIGPGEATAAPPCCPGNADKMAPGQVTFNDVLAVLANFLNPGANPNGTSVGDSNCDGVIDFNDVLNVLANFLALCP